MGKIGKLTTFVLLVFLAGCATMPTSEQIASVDYGAPLSIDYQGAIKESLGKILKDPYSAVYEFETPQQRWFKMPPLLGGELLAGYVVWTDVNAKNSFGGYVGMKRYGFLFKNNRIIRIIGPEELNLMQLR